jgi:cysteine sulfinate desulfinase/cysteine desulfurase-like protein
LLCAIGLSPTVAQGSLVFTLARSTKLADVAPVLEHLPAAIIQLRSFSPVWHKKIAAAGGA